MGERDTYDAVVVGGSIAGCTAAILFGRLGLRVALVERHADPAAFKAPCTHYLQPSAVPTLRRLGVEDDMLALGARTHTPEMWTPMSGFFGTQVSKEGDRVTGIVSEGEGRRELRAQLVVAADGRHGKTGDLANDDGLTLIGVMQGKEKAAAFKQDLGESLLAVAETMPGAPRVREAERVGSVHGMVDMPNHVRPAAAPGIAFVGDAALTSDPIFGVGCGWALQSGDWLAELVGPALVARAGVDEALSLPFDFLGPLTLARMVWARLTRRI